MSIYSDEIPVLAMTGQERDLGIRRFQLGGSLEDIQKIIQTRYDDSFQWGNVPPRDKNKSFIATFSISPAGKLVFEGAEDYQSYYWDCFGGRG